MSDEITDKVSKELTVENQYGIHARPAAMLVKLAGRFSSTVELEHDGTTVSAKSIMGLLTIEGHHGATLTVTAVGDDAEEAVTAIAELFEAKFNEE